MAGRTYAGGRFCLIVDGKTCGFIKKVSGGTIKGNVVEHDLGVDVYKRKHLATIEHDALSFDMGGGVAPEMWEWIKASFDKGYVTKSAELHNADFDYKSQSVREFMDCLITEVSVPTLEGSNKESFYLSVKMTPERIRYSKGTGAVISGEADMKQKKFLLSNFRFELGSLPCSRVAKVEGIKWTQELSADEVGQFREPTKHPTSVKLDNLKLEISAADIAPWQEWHKSFVIDGKCTQGDELTGSLTMLGPDMAEELCTFDFINVGIISLEYGSGEANNNSLARFNVELYVEELKLTYG
jgi:hypothetical protein